MTDVPRKPRAPTSRLTWAVAFAFLVTAVAGGIWAYFTVGPGRTVDTSGIQPGMRLAEVEKLLGRPDSVVVSGDEAAWRYGRTHIWFIGVPGMGSVVTDATDGPRDSAGKPPGRPKMKGPPGFGAPKPGNMGKRPPGPESPKPDDTEK